MTNADMYGFLRQDELFLFLELEPTSETSVSLLAALEREIQ